MELPLIKTTNRYHPIFTEVGCVNCHKEAKEAQRNADQQVFDKVVAEKDARIKELEALLLTPEEAKHLDTYLRNEYEGAGGVWKILEPILAKLRLISQEGK